MLVLLDCKCVRVSVLTCSDVEVDVTTETHTIDKDGQKTVGCRRQIKDALPPIPHPRLPEFGFLKDGEQMS